MQKYINEPLIKKLRSALSLSVTKKEHNERTGSLAISKSGQTYSAGIVESDTHTFNLSSEQISLMLSTISNDYEVSKMITMLETQTSQNYISPIVLKIILDHSIRTGKNIEYTIVNINGEILSKVSDVGSLIPYYKPKRVILSRVNEKPSTYVKNVGKNKNQQKSLKEAAILGLKKNLPLYDSASGYATAVLTKSGKIFFAGQYSSLDKRLSLHSEVNAILAALMNDQTEITDIGLVSTKYPDSPCNMCGNCRQFILEMSQNFNFNPKIYLFSKETNKHKEYSLKNYLPDSWSSKRWKKSERAI